MLQELHVDAQNIRFSHINSQKTMYICEALVVLSIQRWKCYTIRKGGKLKIYSIYNQMCVEKAFGIFKARCDNGVIQSIFEEQARYCSYFCNIAQFVHCKTTKVLKMNGLLEQKINQLEELLREKYERVVNYREKKLEPRLVEVKK